MYSLKYNKKEGILKIEPLGNLMINASEITDVATRYNDYYMVCNNRKALKEKALEMQLQWVIDTENELKRLKEIKIVSRYK